MLSDVERAALEAAAPHDLYLFSRYLFSEMRNYAWLRAPHHGLICEALERVYRKETTRLIITIPPRYSKTELAVVNFAAWALGKNSDAEFIHASYSATLAAQNSGKIRSLMQHEAYKRIFPSLKLDSEAKAHLTTEQGGAFYTVGTGGTLTGFGAGKPRDAFGGAIIIDDPLKADEARSPTMRRNVIEWFQNTLESRANSKDTPIILIMQRLHEDDLSGFLLNGGNGEQWEHLCLPAIQADGTPLWEAKHNMADLRRMERANPYVFAGQYMQSPAPLDGGLFKPDALTRIHALPAGGIRWIRAWDLASTADGGDYTAGAKLGALPDGRYIIAHMVRGQYDTHIRDEILHKTAQADGRKVRISLPQDPGAAGKAQILYLTRQLAGFAVKSSPESGDKITRAEPFAAQVNVGNVLLLDDGTWDTAALVAEMRLFPNGKHDDQIDACSRAFNELMRTPDYAARFRALS